jgi:hypothetical protein
MLKTVIVFNVWLFFATLLFPVSAHAERGIAEIFQPTSLLGTESDDEPLKDGQIMAATIMSRPILIAGAFPESPVAAMCLPHKITGATAGFPEESNLIVLVGAKIDAEFGEKFHTVTADFSHARASEDLGVTLQQVMQLTAECLQRNLQGSSVPIKIQWKTPPRQEALAGKLPKEIKR